ncbi:hypothetical protein ABIB25_004818 [Nakamurella sp. UYEF19]|uniref:hypothetical protein n=1 Tax=Nakamurella sp. UYEF19 TaxID=1756392 RepID=UPI003396B862
MITVNRGGFGTVAADTRLYPPVVDQWMSGNRWVFWPLAVLALLLVLVALRWLLVQMRTDRLGRLVMDSDRLDGDASADSSFTTGPTDRTAEAGRTSLSAGALTSAVVAEIKAITGVRQAAAALSGADDAPELWLRVTVEENADTGAIRAALVDPVLADVRQALEKPDLAVFLTLIVGKARTRRQVA